MYKTSLLALVALTASVMADDGAAVSTRPALVNSNEMRVSADALLWRTEQGGTEWATQQDTSSVSYKDVNFGWNWGFRVAVGMDIDQDEWDTNLSYTWFQAHKHSKAAGDANVYSIANPALGGVNSASAKWHIDYNGLDWDVGGNYMVRTHLAMRPHVGVKFGWINQDVHSSFVGTTTTVNPHLKSKFFGVGPSSGVTSKWNFAEGFNLFGDLSGALMWGNFDIKQSAATTTAGVTTTRSFKNLSRNYVAPVLSTVLGLGWATNFNNDASRFAVNLGYELQYWFRQNQFITGNTNARVAEDLAFQGGTLEFRFDF